MSLRLPPSTLTPTELKTDGCYFHCLKPPVTVVSTHEGKGRRCSISSKTCTLKLDHVPVKYRPPSVAHTPLGIIQLITVGGHSQSPECFYYPKENCTRQVILVLYSLGWDALRMPHTHTLSLSMSLHCIEHSIRIYSATSKRERERESLH